MIAGDTVLLLGLIVQALGWAGPAMVPDAAWLQFWLRLASGGFAVSAVGFVAGWLGF